MDAGGGCSASHLCSRERWGAPDSQVQSPCRSWKVSLPLRGVTMAASISIIVGPCVEQGAASDSGPRGRWRAPLLEELSVGQSSVENSGSCRAQCHAPATHYPASLLPGGPALGHPRECYPCAGKVRQRDRLTQLLCSLEDFSLVLC